MDNDYVTEPAYGFDMPALAIELGAAERVWQRARYEPSAGAVYDDAFDRRAAARKALMAAAEAMQDE